MIFTATPLAGVFLITSERKQDVRGFFARTWCEREAVAHGLNPRVAQCATSYNRKQGTLRGLHYQVAPYAEAKLVRCIAGAIYDVALDLRPDSPTFAQHLAVELTAENRQMLYIPEGLAHGFQTLVDDSEVCYQMSEFHMPQFARGVRYSDPAFGIRWPIAEPVILERDASYPDFALVPG
ncbi:MAG TPA: dTDP-4-dehydrorhamnose 3,5-epimerase [Gemmatimonadales bacterium]|nr:dTDP-4-dehydrorhamnose 3,5-epimerase [Gemmatimonadales bacterium]